MAMTILGLSLGGTSPVLAAPLPSSVAEDQPFLDWYDGLARAIASDRKYKRIPLDTDAQVNAFVVKLHNLYRGKISEDDFFIWVDMTYPGHDYEQIVIVDYYKQNRSKKHK
jgi:hypothetical protein